MRAVAVRADGIVPRGRTPVGFRVKHVYRPDPKKADGVLHGRNRIGLDCALIVSG